MYRHLEKIDSTIDELQGSWMGSSVGLYSYSDVNCSSLLRIPQATLDKLLRTEQYSVGGSNMKSAYFSFLSREDERYLKGQQRERMKDTQKEIFTFNSA
jgi:hypothetical protein